MTGVATTEPGDRRPQLDRPPGERYIERAETRDEPSIVWPPLAVAIAGVLSYTVLGGLLSITAGLIVVAAFVGWLLGRLVARPPRAALVAIVTIAVGLLGIWLFGRIEGGVLDPIAYFDEVQGWPLVALQLVAGGALAAASSR
jgi:hypothetical protein